MEKFKWLTCTQCRKPVRGKLSMGELELLDGYHGECPTCGWLFEAITTEEEKKA